MKTKSRGKAVGIKSKGEVDKVAEEIKRRIKQYADRFK